MKSISLIATLLLAFVTNTASAELVTCSSDHGTQWGDKLPALALVTFEFEKKGNQSSMKNVNGFVFVKNQWEDADDTSFNEENSYRGYFEFDEVKANPNYRPLKYKGHAQFKNFDARYTDGQESGMWGSFVVELKDAKEFKAHYIFQAGDHIGGTIKFTCTQE